jgi:hypothetical protein
MENLLKFKDYEPSEEYKSESRRSLNLDSVRRSKEYKRIIKLGFDEETSHQQEINNTLKFIRSKHKQTEKDHDDVFYTIHPTGTVRRYNPIKAEEIPQGSGNDIKKFIEPFEKPKDYIKGLNYLWQYLKRKEANKDFR